MTHPSKHFLLIGLPGTGKTSFLAALWYVVGQSSIDCGLTLKKLDGDSQYLNQIRDAWAKYKPVPRNKADSEKTASMWLENRENGAVAQLSFPDLSGEAFRSQWTQRQMATSYEKNLQDSTRGGILFVHPENIIKPHRIDTVNAALDHIGDDAPGTKAKSKSKPWDSERSPTQVQLVDILQFMAEREGFLAPYRLAIVVSAWDRVSTPSRRPDDWLGAELPLLKQFLDSNRDSFEVSYYGISAQGARYALPHFWSDNFKDAKAFATAICECRDPISIWIWEKLDPGSHGTLQLLQAESDTTEQQRKGLAKDFNRLMADPDIYESERFADVELRSETQSLLEKGALTIEEEKIYLTRLLLEDAYPQTLSREREHAREASELQQKLPVRRILVVGDNVKESHDVTEPIQWLMR